MTVSQAALAAAVAALEAADPMRPPDSLLVNAGNIESVARAVLTAGMQEHPVVANVVALWNENNGWIPAASRADLAAALGVPVDTLNVPRHPSRFYVVYDPYDRVYAASLDRKNVLGYGATAEEAERGAQEWLDSRGSQP